MELIAAWQLTLLGIEVHSDELELLDQTAEEYDSRTTKSVGNVSYMKIWPDVKSQLRKLVYKPDA